MNYNRRITKLLKSFYTDYIGFADLKNYQDDLFKTGGNIVKNYRYGISAGLVIPDSIVDHLPERKDMNVSCEYKIHGYDVLNMRLNIIASTVSSYLNSRGFKTLPVAAADRTDEENAIPTVSHKTIAHIAGLGWIGKSCLLITPEHGPRVRFVSILTDAPLKAADRQIEQRCGSCDICVKACPVNAIKGKNYISGEQREERFDFKKCQRYFEKMKAEQKYDVCGICLYSCPAGKISPDKEYGSSGRRKLK